MKRQSVINGLHVFKSERHRLAKEDNFLTAKRLKAEYEGLVMDISPSQHAIVQVQKNLVDEFIYSIEI